MKREKLSINDLKNKAKVLKQESAQKIKGGFVIGADIIET